jgi:GH24 family phage-related lysozyme (muramidase)
MNEVLAIAADIAKPFEGLRLDPYHDPVGYPTIGYGHLLSRKPWANLGQWKSISEDEAEHLLQQDMSRAQLAVSQLIDVELNENQEAALIDFTFNCGGGNLQASNLRRVINRGEPSSPVWYAAGTRKQRYGRSKCLLSNGHNLPNMPHLA